MIYRSKAPLRIGLAGGGTDVSPYSDQFGGAILNITVSLHAFTTIEPIQEEKVILDALDRNECEEHELSAELPINGTLDLVKGVYNRIQKEYTFPLQGMRISTYVDAPAGSGLGTSSTLVVAILGAFKEMLKLPLSDYDIAQLAYDIERKDLALSGGKQDQYAATFGGVNFMEFLDQDKVIVNPLRIKSNYISELENNLLLFSTETSRESAKIIDEQSHNVSEKKSDSLEAMHLLKKQAFQMKEAFLKGKLDEVGFLLHEGFEYKRRTAKSVSNDLIEELYEAALKAGAIGGKISGAGGGGFMIFYCPRNTRYRVIQALSAYQGKVVKYSFAQYGLRTWTVE
jgi:D-glycero-alpha-D-manno-heptose-7-phosphate kinase